MRVPDIHVYCACVNLGVVRKGRGVCREAELREQGEGVEGREARVGVGEQGQREVIYYAGYLFAEYMIFY